MIGLLIELGVSWLLLWFFFKEHIGVLGFQVSKRRLGEFSVGMLIAVISCSIYLLLIAWLRELDLSINPEYNVKMLLSGMWWVLKSVLYEELLFRGALLYIAIRKIGAVKACILSSVIFGVYHWFSYDIFGEIIPMIYVFMLTGAAGFIFSISFAETRSMYLQIGLHLGWNVINILLFSNGPLGNQILVSVAEVELSELWSLLLFLYQVFFLPAITFLYLKKCNYSPSVIRRTS